MVVSQFQVSGLWECSSLAHLVHDPSADIPSSKTTTRWQISACILGVLCRRGNGVCWVLEGLIDRPKAILASTPLGVCMYQVAAVSGGEIGGEIERGDGMAAHKERDRRTVNRRAAEEKALHLRAHFLFHQAALPTEYSCTA